EEAPDVHAGALVPTVAGPGLVVWLALGGNRSKRPDERARVHVPRANVAGRTVRRILLRAPAGNDEVAIDLRRRAEPVAAGQAAQDLRRVEIDDALVAERRVEHAGLGVDGVE